MKSLQQTKSKIDLSGKKKKKTWKEGYEGPWKHDFKNNCKKCNRAFHLQRHHIIYKPKLVVFLCEHCHNMITRLNTKTARIANTNKKTKPIYTNQVRATLWLWFINNPWPVDNETKKAVKTPSKEQIVNLLNNSKLKYTYSMNCAPRKLAAPTQGAEQNNG